MAVTSSQAVETSDYHAKFHAQVLSLRHTGDSTDKLASSLANAVVDLNPHQNAALFAFQSPLSNGVVLASGCWLPVVSGPTDGRSAAIIGRTVRY